MTSRWRCSSTGPGAATFRRIDDGEVAEMLADGEPPEFSRDGRLDSRRSGPAAGPRPRGNGIGRFAGRRRLARAGRDARGRP